VTVSFGFQQHDRKTNCGLESAKTLANRGLKSAKTLANLHIPMSRSAYARGKVCISSVLKFTVVLVFA
jgi:hypothetical protein